MKASRQSRYCSKVIGSPPAPTGAAGWAAWPGSDRVAAIAADAARRVHRIGFPPGLVAQYENKQRIGIVASRVNEICSCFIHKKSHHTAACPRGVVMAQAAPGRCEEVMPDFAIERGCAGVVCGIDEAGRGP